MPTTIPVAKVGCTLKTPDGLAHEIFEGDIVNDLVYTVSGVTKVLTGAVRVIIGSTQANTTEPDVCPPEPYLYQYIKPDTLVIDSSEENDAILDRVTISSIVSIGEVQKDGGAVQVGPGAQYQSITDTIKSLPDGGIVKLAPGEYEQEIEICKSVSIVSTEGAILDKPIKLAASLAKVSSVPAPAEDAIDLTLDGLTFTNEGCINLTGTGIKLKSLTINNCTFKGVTKGCNTNDKTDILIEVGTNNPTHVNAKDPLVFKLTNCTFMDNAEGAIKNICDCWYSVTTGTDISNNTFTKGCCHNNMINLFALPEGGASIIQIANNVAEYSCNMIHFAFVGAPVGTINVVSNAYNTTSTGDEEKYAGLFLLEPFLADLDWSKVTINVDKTKMASSSKQIGYIFIAPAAKETFTEDKYPTININGVETTIPDVSAS